MAVSFSSGAKAEVCRTFPQKHCCALAESFGILLYCNSFGADGIRIITESREFAQILPKMFKKAFSVTFDQYPDAESQGKLVFQITDAKKLTHIMSAYGFDARDTLALHVNMPIVEEECCRAAFLRGAFLAGGSVTDPAKGYHIELTTTHNSVAAESYMLMEDVLGFYPKTALRSGAQVLYIKQSDMISDFLTYLSAPVAAMGIVQKINMIPVQIALGVSQGIMPLISYNYASRNFKRMKESFTFTVKIAMIFIGAMVTIYYIGAGSIVGTFMKNDIVVAIGSKLLRGFCIGLPFMIFDFIAVGVFQATGMGKNALIFALARKLVLEIPAIFILDMLFPLYGLAYSQFVAEFILTIIAIGVIHKLFKKLEQRHS